MGGRGACGGSGGKELPVSTFVVLLNEGALQFGKEGCWGCRVFAALLRTWPWQAENEDDAKVWCPVSGSSQWTNSPRV